ncbi:GNAT family N-acetyltransferase [Paenibacillus sp. L3-i20]|uniref:GNAT family N-acetyltransferase n=1 Tax=Paenibacillus sp. L3-i20 TaxID=2905833 RepID=UPI001EDD935F|nr:GNAT family N-acetyltransferase [Paenibacillus sp. L3-i20]GKU79214.1 N-acetyltransferase [Paenibacillus sp. L3-i20]
MITKQRVETKEQMDEAYRIRKDVFVREQGVPEEVEIDEHESDANHVLVLYNGEPAGVGRIRQVDGIAKIERICVLEPFRKHKIGVAIMEELEAIAKEHGFVKAKLHAQTQAAGFYEKLGYKVDSEPFTEEDIPHIRMTKTL